jgi:RNA polymerase sigma-70 factor (ECF subfamily)
MTVFPEVPDEKTTIDLVRRAKGGEEEAWNRLFERYHDHLLLAVRLRLGRRLRSVLESGDIFQSVALEAFRDLGQFTPEGEGSFRAYLNRLVLNKITDRARYFEAAKRQGGKNLSKTGLEKLPQLGEELSYHDSSGRFESLEREIQRLPEEMREVLLMRNFDGFTSQEVARVVGKSDDAVRKIYSRAVARLATRLGDEGGV